MEGQAAGEIRQAILQRLNGTQTRYPEDLKQSALAYFRMEVGRGRPRNEVARELGLDSNRLRKWDERDRGLAPTTPRFHQVEVAPTPIVHSPFPVSVLGPCGIRVEGLGLDAIAELIRKLA